MDTTLPELGPGIKPADRPVWGEAYPVSVKEKTGTAHPIKSVLQSYAINISSIAGNIRSYSRDRMWAAPTYRFYCQCLFSMQKFKNHV